MLKIFKIYNKYKFKKFIKKRNQNIKKNRNIYEKNFFKKQREIIESFSDKNKTYKIKLIK